MKYWLSRKVSKTVYSLFYPETKTILTELWDSNPLFLYEKAYRGVQDDYQNKFLNAWKKWVSSAVIFPKLSYFYPCAGSSEGIRESLAQYALDCHEKNIMPILNIFEGEYEGYEAYAQGYNIKVIKHERSNWKNIKLSDNETFFISQPSAIDGNVWKNFNKFIIHLNKNSPKASVCVDLCYVGAVAKKYHIDINQPNVDKVFFSLSKLFGVYYHRIGGVLSKEEIPGLVGNMWFKNMFSLFFGLNLLKQFSLHELPKKYLHLQKEAINKLSKASKTKWKKSDVIMLAHCTKSLPDKKDRFLMRGNKNPNMRACLTPFIDERLNEEFNSSKN